MRIQYQIPRYNQYPVSLILSLLLKELSLFLFHEVLPTEVAKLNCYKNQNFTLETIVTLELELLQIAFELDKF